MLVNNKKKFEFVLMSIGVFVILHFAWIILDILIYGDSRPNGMDTIFGIYLSILYSYNYQFSKFKGPLFMTLNGNLEYIGSILITYLKYVLAWLCLSMFIVSDTKLPDITDSIIIVAVLGRIFHSAYMHIRKEIS